MAVDEGEAAGTGKARRGVLRNSRQPERTFVTSPLQPGLDYTFIGIDKHAVAAFRFIGSVRTGSSRAPAGGDFYVDPSSMLRPEQRVEARVSRCMERYGSSQVNLH